jgi:hypothetical protein
MRWYKMYWVRDLLELAREAFIFAAFMVAFYYGIKWVVEYGVGYITQ